MKTIQEAVEITIRKTPFIEEALNEKLINVSSLARVILPEVSTLLKKEIKVGAVMMAINRLSPANELRIRKNVKRLALDLGDVIVRSDLCDFTFKNTTSLLKEIAKTTGGQYFRATNTTKLNEIYEEINKLEKQDLLIIDDFGLKALDNTNRHVLMEIIEDRHGKKATIIASQLPTQAWHEVIGEQTIADAILDRIVHSAHRINLIGESMRKKLKK